MYKRQQVEKDLAARIVAGEDQGGHLTEQLLETMATRQGYTVLPGGKYGGGSGHGFDVVLQGPDGNVTFLLEGKQMKDGAFRLAKGAGGNVQLTEDWIDTCLLYTSRCV